MNDARDLEVFPIDYTAKHVESAAERRRTLHREAHRSRMDRDASAPVLLTADRRVVRTVAERIGGWLQWGFLAGVAAWLAWQVLTHPFV